MRTVTSDPVVGSGDVLHREADRPWLIRLPVCDSSNTWALAHLDTLDHGDVVWALEQRGGRGQHGRHWLSPPGCLCLSCVLDLPPHPANQRLALIAGLAVALSVEDALPAIQVALKWPNDCLVNGAKLAGILCEGRCSGTRHRIVVGIGLNRAPDWAAAGIDPDTVGQAVIGLDSLGAEPPPALDLIDSLHHYLLEGAGLIATGRWDQLLPALRQRDHLIGRRLRLDGGSGSQAPLHGHGAGIDDDGRLILRDDHGAEHPISSASVTILDPVVPQGAP